MKTLLLSVLALAVGTIDLNANSNGKMIIRLNPNQEGFSVRQLPPSLDIAGQDVSKGEVDIVVNEEQLERFRSMGLSPQVIQVQPSAVESGYLTPDEITQLIKEAAENYPDIVHVIEIGRSHKNFPIYAVRLSTQDSVELKPSILFNGMHHAREVMTPEVTTDIIQFLTKNFDNAEMPFVRDWLENMAIWVIPQLNPDGNNIVWSEDNWWRKNAKGDEWEIWGVDLNRNYPFQWGACRGSSGSKGSDTFRGESGGSEPETRAIMGLVKRENMALNISYHSYSEMVVSPYGCKGQYTPEEELFKSIGKTLASKLVKDTGKGTYSYGTGWELLYPVDGEDISWMYNEVGTIAYVIEVNSSSQGFQPNYSKWRNITVERQRQGWMYLLNRLQSGTQARGRITNASTGELINASIKIKGVKYGDEKGRHSKLGHYVKLLNPGSYELEFSAPGFKTTTMAVSIGEGIAEMDVSLEPAASWLVQPSAAQEFSFN
jgi:hypothetical protein